MDTPWPKPWPDSIPLTPLHALPLTDSLRNSLRKVREQQMDEHRAGRPQLVCGVFYEEEVVCLRVFGGHAAYLGTDGRLHYENFAEGLEKELLTDPRDVASTLVKWAADIGLPQLVDQLPTRPANGFVCQLCNGTRLEGPLGDPQIQRWCCRRCQGLGWTMAERIV